MKTYTVRLAEVEGFAQTFSQTLKGGETIALIGPLGAGKTSFTKRLGKKLGIKRTITSPTFIMAQEFGTNKKTADSKPIILHHLDVYRISSPQDALLLGLEEFWGRPDTITVIEWADKIKDLLPKNAILIYFT
jgi:tRNA threonylcarbamoyladenosine biosynthesis protein TsaE